MGQVCSLDHAVGAGRRADVELPNLPPGRADGSVASGACDAVAVGGDLEDEV